MFFIFIIGRFSFRAFRFLSWASIILFFPLVQFTSFVFSCSRGVILAGVWVILALGPLAVGPSFLVVWAWTCLGLATLFLCLTLIIAMTFILSNATL